MVQRKRNITDPDPLNRVLISLREVSYFIWRTICDRILYKKSVITWKNKNYPGLFKHISIFQWSFDGTDNIFATHVIQRSGCSISMLMKYPHNQEPIIGSLEKLEQLSTNISTNSIWEDCCHPKGQQCNICNVPVECDQT